MYKEKQFNRIIKQICQEKNIQYEELSDDWIIKLKKDNKIMRRTSINFQKKL